MRRRTVIKALAGAGLIPVAAGCGSSSSSSSAATSASKTYPLQFAANSYTTLTKKVNTGSGTRTVKYRFYRNNVYVQHPVNYRYQSLNVSVPVEIDGKTVNATNAPIMFAINVGGYTSSSTWGATAQGGGTSAGSFGGGFGASGPSGAPTGGAAGGAAPGGASGAPGGGAPGGSAAGGAPGGAGGASSVGLGTSMSSYYTSYDDGEMALANGYVVVEPGCRGRDLKWSDGQYYGKAPTMIVDLKAAVRYLRYNKGAIPGNTDWIISTGGSAGGALSTLLAASGNSSLYDADLKALGAAGTDDNVFLSASYSPITDLDHADMQYEWMWGTLPDMGGGTPGNTSTSSSSTGKLVNQTYSKQLTTAFGGYLDTLALPGINGYGTLTAENYADYLLKQYLEPAAARALRQTLTATEQETYLAKNTWITWSGGQAAFTWNNFLEHVGQRSKGVPAFDAFDLSATENAVYGDATHDARHFTLYSLRHASGNSAQLASDLPQTIAMMNPMYHLRAKNPSRARYWWIRTGTLDTNTAHTVVGNLAAITSKLGDSVNSALYWDGGHAVNFDSPDLIAWVNKLTGYSV